MPDARKKNYRRRKNLFNDTIREINKLVLPHLEQGTRKHLEEERIIALGGKPSKRAHVNLPELQRQRHQERLEAEERLRSEKELGVVLGAGSKARSEAEKKKREIIAKKRQLRVVGKATSGSTGIGREKAGVLKLYKSFNAA